MSEHLEGMWWTVNSGALVRSGEFLISSAGYDATFVRPSTSNYTLLKARVVFPSSGAADFTMKIADDDAGNFLGARFERGDSDACLTVTLLQGAAILKTADIIVDHHGYSEADSLMVAVQYYDNGELEAVVETPFGLPSHGRRSRVNADATPTGGLAFRIEDANGGMEWFDPVTPYDDRSPIVGNVRQTANTLCDNFPACVIQRDWFNSYTACGYTVLSGAPNWLSPSRGITFATGDKMRFKGVTPKSGLPKQSASIVTYGKPNETYKFRVYVAADASLGDGVFAEVEQKDTGYGGLEIWVRVGSGDTVTKERKALYSSGQRLVICVTPTYATATLTNPLSDISVSDYITADGDYAGFECVAAESEMESDAVSWLEGNSPENHAMWSVTQQELCYTCPFVEGGDPVEPPGDCDVCTGAVPTFMSVTKSLIQNTAQCGDCDQVNGTDDLTWIGGCVWQKNHGPIGCVNAGGDVIETLTYFERGGGGWANLTITGIGQWEGGISSMPFPCTYDPSSPIPFAWIGGDHCDAENTEVYITPGPTA